MDLGVQIEPQFGFTYEAIRDIARVAHAAGFTRLWVSDHLLLHKDAVATDCLEAWTVLAGLARDTEGIRIGPMVSCQSYRNPALLAKIAAGVDRMSGGRLEFGVGAGWKDVEYGQYGYDFPDAPTRVSQLVDTLEICTRLWTEERVTYAGKHYRVSGAVCSPKPAQRPLPVWIGGSKPRIMRIAAKYAHWFNVGEPGRSIPERVAEMRSGLAEACRAVGRDPATLHTSVFALVYTGATRGAVDELLDELAARAKLPRAEWLAGRPGAIVGTVDEVASHVAAIARSGVEHVNVMLPYGHELDGVRVLSELARG